MALSYLWSHVYCGFGYPVGVVTYIMGVAINFYSTNYKDIKMGSADIKHITTKKKIMYQGIFSAKSFSTFIKAAFNTAQEALGLEPFFIHRLMVSNLTLPTSFT